MEKFIQGSFASFTTVFISEIGDRTFMILTVLAQKQSISAIILGNQIAMTPLIIIAAILGKVASFIPSFYLNLISCVCFLVFAGFAFKESYSEYKKTNESDSDSDEKIEPLLDKIT